MGKCKHTPGFKQHGKTSIISTWYEALCTNCSESVFKQLDPVRCLEMIRRAAHGPHAMCALKHGRGAPWPLRRNGKLKKAHI